VRDAQILIEITRKSQLIVCFVHRVQQIYDDHTYVDAASIANKAWRARSRLRVTRADENRIQSSLNIASDQLSRISIVRLVEYKSEYMLLTPGRKYQPASDSMPLADIVEVLGGAIRSETTARKD